MESAPSALLAAAAVVVALGLAACSATGPPKPPPPPIEGIKDAGSPAPAASSVARAPAPPGAPNVAAPAVTAGPTVLPTVPPVVAEAAAAAPPPPGAVDESDLPAGSEVAEGVIAALAKAKTAHLSATLPTGHVTDINYVAPDRAGLVEQDENGSPYAEYIIIGDTGYYNETRSGTGWRKVGQDQGYRKQAEIFRPIQVALATGKARTLPSGNEVETIDRDGKTLLHALFEYSSSQELQDLGLMRSTGNLLDVIVDPATWLPVRTREETETGGPDKSVTEVRFLSFDQPTTVDAPVQ
ncbi:MAG TPA: hypothetical protein VII06_03450 [Chloroflexota bacterium]